MNKNFASSTVSFGTRTPPTFSATFQPNIVGVGGKPGKDGTTFIPSVSEEGILSWTNNGGLDNPTPIKVKGESGKSAYEYAVEAGYTGTPEDFAEKLASTSNGNVSFKTDETLKLENGILSVNTAKSVSDDNTLPITAAAVHATVGNIEILLSII